MSFGRCTIMHRLVKSKRGMVYQFVIVISGPFGYFIYPMWVYWETDKTKIPFDRWLENSVILSYRAITGKTVQ